MDNRYQLEKSKEEEGVWVYTDKENLVVCKFKQHEFNETQKFSFLEESTLVKDKGAEGLSKIMSEMGDWLAKNHYDIAMPPSISPRFELKKNGSQYFCTDNENNVQSNFKIHGFDKHELKIINNGNSLDLNDLARVVEEMKDWLSANHYNIANPKRPTYELDEIEGHVNIIRNKFPQWELYVLEKVNQEELAEECKKAAEYILNPNLGGYVWEENKEDGIKWVLRSHEFSQWELYLDDKVDKNVDDKVLSDSLKKTAEWLRKGCSDFYK